MKKKLLLALIGVLLIAMFFVHGAHLEVLTKNIIQLFGFAGIALIIVIMTRIKDEE
jgi:hypothetical protein